MLITYVDLAKLKNVSRSAVSQRKAKGLFKKAIIKTVNGKDYLDKDLAFKAWDGIVNTDIVKHEPIKDVTKLKKEVIDQVDELPVELIPDINESRARKTHFEAKLAEIEYKLKNEELVDKREYEKSAFEMATGLRNKLMILPDRVASLFSLETDAAVIGKTLKEELIMAIRSAIKETA